ncbi:MAG: NAD(P)-dependent oxidoreductase [Ruminococcaceae bacterium]|nr:NAD(P)-dependent oxidoreductase [Oscillospiraceae bacterium]MBR3595390.1 NAD(P)-dependent oxidoreductase [Clostridia bacterium]
MKIGFIGLGIMGESMCENIVKKHDDTVYCNDHKDSQIKKLESMGCVGCYSNLEIAEKSDVIITMIPTGEHVKQAYREMLPALKAGKICIDMSTIEPWVSVEVSREVKKTGAQFADCPVVRSKADAIKGTLGVLAGCEEKLFPVIEPILYYMGCKVIYMGENGKGLSAKICHNTLVAEIQNGVNETLILAEKLGISIDNFAEAVAAGGAQNAYMAVQREKLKNEDWTTAFSMENMYKDVSICSKIAEDENFYMPGMKAAKDALSKGVENGWAKDDFRKTYLIVKS